MQWWCHNNKHFQAAAKHEAERLEQEAKGRLERQKISDEAEAEKSRRGLLELQVTIGPPLVYFQKRSTLFNSLVGKNVFNHPKPYDQVEHWYTPGHGAPC